MIHRDISPSNIMILPDGKVKLLDFGAVREVSAETQSLSTMSSVYKYGYSPIEQQTRDMKQGSWKWVYGKESDFQDWGTNARGQQQPNHENRNEDWAQLDTRMLNGHWNDSEYGRSTYAYLCEWDTAASSSKD